ncbi:MAG: AAA family ATPase [Alphaproteobacteria bacterium]|nr:AAA family ATPase [Alphaproteobacteria bacterium]
MAKSTTDLPHNLVAFVNDPVSEQIVWNVIREMNMAYAEAKMGSIADTLEFLKESRSPKILIVDVSNSELPLGDIEKIKEFSSPNISIIVVGSRNEVGLFRDLKAAGVVDYIVKPLSNVLLRRAIEQANGIKSEILKEGKLIHIMSATGGAGATTVAANVGWLLANRRFKRTLVMDLDFLYGTANLLLDIKAENAYLDILESPDKIDDYFTETILKKCTQRLYYLGGLCDLVRGVQVDINAFDALMTLLKKQFNYVLVDSQRDINEINKVSMRKADSFIIMVEMTMASAQNAARLLEFLSVEYGGKKIIMIDNKNGLSSSGAITKESFEEVIGRKIDYVMPLDETITLAAANIGQPLVISEGPLTEILEEVADDVLGKNENQAIAQAISEKEGFNFEKLKNDILSTIGKYMKK